MNDVTIYHCKDDRLRVYDKKTKTVTSYPRILLEQKLSRKLLLNEQVHHKDGNPLNNDPNNLELVILGEHQRRHSQKYHDIIIKCTGCGQEFLWTAKQQSMFYQNKKRRKSIGPFCSKHCSGIYGKEKQLSRCDETGETFRT